MEARTEDNQEVEAIFRIEESVTLTESNTEALLGQNTVYVAYFEGFEALSNIRCAGLCLMHSMEDPSLYGFVTRKPYWVICHIWIYSSATNENMSPTMSVWRVAPAPFCSLYTRCSG